MLAAIKPNNGRPVGLYGCHVWVAAGSNENRIQVSGMTFFISEGV
jgi:hypothetical protein